MSVMYRILAVDDAREIGEMLAIFFDKHGYQVHTALSGEEAYRICRQVQPHIVLMDVTMPGQGGFETVERIREHPRTAHIPVIFLTARTGRTDKMAGLELGADDYITKPFDLNELLLRVENALERARGSASMRLSTALPDSRVARSWVATENRNMARLEFRLEHGHAYRKVYGDGAHAAVEAQLAHTLLESTGRHDNDVLFIGHFDAETMVAVCPPRLAESLGETVCQTFNALCDDFYQNSTHTVDEPHMRLLYAVHYPQDRVSP